MDDAAGTKKRARKSDAAPAAQAPAAASADMGGADDVLDEVDDELVDWNTQKKSKKRKSDAPRGTTRERSNSTRAPSAEAMRRSVSRVEADADTRKDDASEQDDDDAESDGAEGDALAEDEFTRQQTIYATQQRNMGLLSHLMDEEQLERHMASRRGTLNKGSVRKLVNHVLSQSVNQHIVMAASGVGKVFVGEMVEQARAVQRERHESGPIQPVHLYEAYRRYKLAQERPGHYPPGASSGAPGLGRPRRLF
ncbi:hypothetical protein MCAP1_000885 [Malassezia caprae]|uniref:TAFII28-like protein domain-containing protein n=1 Tax=Malassezia caprae TaxID=1381934 RepID=A0AAF0E717_9BASI|nr:hypothetical protein MCAP1_000885 [Malassezia caprae]